MNSVLAAGRPHLTGCPAFSSDVGSENELTEQQVEGQVGLETLDKKLGSVDAGALAKSISDAANKAETVVLDGSDEDSSDDEEDRILASEIEKLKIQLEQDEEKKRLDKKEKKKQNRLRLEKEKADLLRRTKSQKSPVPPGHVLSSLPVTSPTERQNIDQGLQRKAADLAARQQQQAADRRCARKAASDNLTIAQLRSIPGIPSEVERLLAGLQSSIPSLAKTPTAPSTNGVSFQPAGVAAVNVPGGEEYDTEFVFHSGRGKFVPVVGSPSSKQPRRSSIHKQYVPTISHDTGHETSADEDCSLDPPPGYRFLWKRDEHGEKYFIEEKVKDSTADMVQAYVCDEETGRWYRRSVFKAELTVDRSAVVGAEKPRQAGGGSTPAYRDHRLGATSPLPVVRRGTRTPAAAAPPRQGDRLPGIVPLDSEKQGKDIKIPDRVQWARNCPVDWTSKASQSNLNVVLWGWAYVAELLATRTGMAPNLENGELESRLQHFCNVLEITMQSSTLTDFGGDAWAVARLYDRKVQQKVDSKLFSWVQLTEMNHGASLPHELIAATQELAKKPKAPKKSDYGDGKKDGSRGKPSKKCPTWNTSETKGKCDWEVENAPDKCLNLHECSWCKSKGFTPRFHQRSFCRKRMAEEEG